jgi:hypothetical protein
LLPMSDSVKRCCPRASAGRADPDRRRRTQRHPSVSRTTCASWNRGWLRVRLAVCMSRRASCIVSRILRDDVCSTGGARPSMRATPTESGPEPHRMIRMAADRN